MSARDRESSEPATSVRWLWHQRADRYRAGKPTRDFPFAGGRRAQRAYFDAFRDLVAPSFGLRVLRVPAPECDGALAYQRLHAALEAVP
jgi:hypothetical protein